MNSPGASLTGVPDAGNVDSGKFELEGVDVRVPKPADIQGLLAQSVSLGDLTMRLEDKYKGYTLPDHAYVEKMLSDKNKNLGRLKSKLDFSGNRFSFLYLSEDGKVVRSSRYDESDSETAMDSNDRDNRNLQDFDSIFLVKNTSH